MKIVTIIVSISLLRKVYVQKFWNFLVLRKKHQISWLILFFRLQKHGITDKKMYFHRQYNVWNNEKERKKYVFYKLKKTETESNRCSMYNSYNPQCCSNYCRCSNHLIFRKLFYGVSVFPSVYSR